MSVPSSRIETDDTTKRADGELPSGEVREDESASLPWTVYSPESPLRNPGKVFRDIWTEFGTSRELIWTLFMRDIKAQYRQSYLGYLWILISPLGASLVWIFLNSQSIVQVSETAIPYPAFVLVGTILWSTFSSALSQPLGAFNAGRGVFMRLKVPPEAFLAKGMADILFGLSIRLLLLVPVFCILRVVPPLTALLFPVALVCLLLFATAVGLLMVPLGALYTDVSRATGKFMGIAMYLTPVVFPPPETGWSAAIIKFNPVTPLIMTARDWLTLGPSEYAGPMFMIAGVSMILLIVGAVMFRVAMPHLVVRLGM